MEITRKTPVIKGESYNKSIINRRVPAIKRYVGLQVCFYVRWQTEGHQAQQGREGNPFKTERAAIKEREATIIQVQAELLQPPKPVRNK